MNKLIPFSITVFSFLVVNHAYAGGQSGISNNATCYVFKNNQLKQKSSCKMYFEEGGAISYNFSNYSVKMDKIGVINVIDGESCDDAGTHCKKAHTVNKKTAVSQYRSVKNYKILDQQQAEKLSEEQVLNCHKIQDNSLEICAVEGSVLYGDRRPKWADIPYDPFF